MGILKSLEFIPGVKMFESSMHDALFQHSVFGAIIFLIVSNTGVYKFVKDTIFSVTGFKADGNTLQFIHAVVFAVIMYFGSMYLLAPLLAEGYSKPVGKEGFTSDPNASITALEYMECIQNAANKPNALDYMRTAQLCTQQHLNSRTETGNASSGTGGGAGAPKTPEPAPPVPAPP